MILETSRLALREITLEDAAFIYELVNEPAWLRFIGDRGVTSVERARAYIETGFIDSYDRNGYGLYVVELKGTHHPLGICGLVNRDSLDDVDVGFAFLEENWGQGYATESTAAVLSLAHRDFGLNRIVAITTPDNHASIRVLEKTGLTFEKKLRLGREEHEVSLFAWKAPDVL